MTTQSPFMFGRAKLLGDEDLDTLGLSGIYEVSGGTNAPDSGRHYVLNILSASEVPGSRPALQMAWDALTGQARTRVRAGNTWSSWAEDAATLDALHISMGDNASYGLYVSSNDASPDSGANLVKIEATDANWNRPLLRIIDVSTNGAAVNIRIDSPNPDIELIETDQTSPAGKFEIAVQSNIFQVNSRNALDDSFETIVAIAQRRTTTDLMALLMDSTSATRDALVIKNFTSSVGARPGFTWRAEGASYDVARMSAQQGASSVNSKWWLQVADASKVLQDRLSVDVTGIVHSIAGGFKFPDNNVATAFSADGTLAGNSDATIPTQKAVKTYVDQITAANDAMIFKGVIDASGNPNYPAADRGHTYRISVAGKIGGASGTNVEVGDLIICLTDATSAGTQAGVGAAWSIAQTNLDGAVIGPSSAVGDNFATFNSTSGKLIKDSGLALDTDTFSTGGFSGFSFSAGTKSSGTFTPAMASGNVQHATNGGAHTLAPPSTVGTMIIEYTNNGSAGVITTSGYSLVTGDGFDTTNTNKFICFITKTNSYSHLHIQALQ